MGLIQQMEEECDCTEVIFQDYIQTRGNNKVFLFFEGKDDYKYYWGKLSYYVGKRTYKKYICNCKDNVLSINKMITSKTKQRKDEFTLYFIDMDFDKNINFDHDIYVTPTYSIENLYISDSAIKNMIIGELGLSSEDQDEDKKDLDVATKYLISKRDEIIQSMIYANAWYSLQCNKAKTIDKEPKLSAIKNYNTIKNINDKNTLEQLVVDFIEVTDRELQKEIAYLSNEPEKKLRGKYFEQTMPHFIMKLFEDSNRKSGRNILLKRRKVNINIGADNMISVLSNYADIPDNLIEYIEHRFNR